MAQPITPNTEQQPADLPVDEQWDEEAEAEFDAIFDYLYGTDDARDYFAQPDEAYWK